jgi:hypothetical protein
VIDRVQREGVICAKRAACTMNTSLLGDRDIRLPASRGVATAAACERSQRVIATKEEEPAVSSDHEAPIGARAGNIHGTGHVRNLLPANVPTGLPGRSCGNEKTAADKHSNRDCKSHGA